MHRNSWEATDALRKKLEQSGIKLLGAPGGWAEVYRSFKACKVLVVHLHPCRLYYVLNDYFDQFVEDEGNVVFYKNAHGIATTRPAFADLSASDSGVELDK